MTHILLLLLPPLLPPLLPLLLLLLLFRRSPWSAGPAVATPQELRPYVDAFSLGSSARSPAAAAAAAAASPGSPLPVGQLYYGDQGDQGLAASPALPLGRDAPHYRPSLVSSNRQYSPNCGGGGVWQYSQQAVQSTLWGWGWRCLAVHILSSRYSRHCVCDRRPVSARLDDELLGAGELGQPSQT
jgi:hypothetical protein